MQADMSSTITQVETLQSYLEQGIEAVMVKDDAILRKQATEKVEHRYAVQWKTSGSVGVLVARLQILCYDYCGPAECETVVGD